MAIEELILIMTTGILLVNIIFYAKKWKTVEAKG